MEQRRTLITLGVENLDKMRLFYENIFEWKPLNNSNENIVFFQLNGIQLALFGREELADDANIESDGSGFKGFTLAYNLRTKEEVNQLFSELKSKDMDIVKSPKETPWGGYSGYVSDPENNLWEIAFNPFMEYDKVSNVLE
jgi:uncharacterized glyoxalase superfamily protein PhnB